MQELEDDILTVNDALSYRIGKRVRQVLVEIFPGSKEYYAGLNDLQLARECKRAAIKYNCFIQSWLSTPTEGCSECYNAATRDEEDDSTYGLIAAPTEAQAVIVAFMWLSDRGNFTPEAIKTIREEVG